MALSTHKLILDAGKVFKNQIQIKLKKSGSYHMVYVQSGLPATRSTLQSSVVKKKVNKCNLT